MFKKHIKGIIVGMTISLALVVTACSTTSTVEGFEEETFVFDYMDSEYGFKCFIMTDKNTGVEYIVLEKLGSGNGNYPITITPRLQANKLVKYK